MRRLSLLLAVAILALSGCAGGASKEPAASPTPSPAVSLAGGPPSVSGTVTAGPVCPVEKSPPDPACAPRPVAGAVIVATDGHGRELARVTSLADGSYLLIVGQTGEVVITAQPVTGLLRAPDPVRITLTVPGQGTHLDLQYDTGIR